MQKLLIIESIAAVVTIAVRKLKILNEGATKGFGKSEIDTYNVFTMEWISKPCEIEQPKYIENFYDKYKWIAER